MPGGDVVWEGSSLSNFYATLWGGGGGAGGGVSTATFHSDGTNEFDVNEATAAAYASALSSSQVVGTSNTSDNDDPGSSAGSSTGDDSIEELPGELTDFYNSNSDWLNDPASVPVVTSTLIPVEYGYPDGTSSDLSSLIEAGHDSSSFESCVLQTWADTLPQTAADFGHHLILSAEGGLIIGVAGGGAILISEPELLPAAPLVFAVTIGQTTSTLAHVSLNVFVIAGVSDVVGAPLFCGANQLFP